MSLCDGLQSRSLELAEAHGAELNSLKGAIQGLQQQNKEMQAELQLLRGQEQQHLIDLEQAQESISDLRQAAQQTKECHSLMCSAALDSAASCRSDLGPLAEYIAMGLADGFEHKVLGMLMHRPLSEFHYEAER